MRAKLAAFILLLTGAAVSTAKAPDPQASSPLRILFVGNSFTSANGGLNVLLEQLAASIDPVVPLSTAAITIDGATLKTLWRAPNVRAAVQSGAYELLVLQGDIPEGDLPTFHEHARSFVAEALKAGTRPVLLMGWAYERLGWPTGQGACHRTLFPFNFLRIRAISRSRSRGNLNRAPILCQKPG